jgi:hypothetical protein
MPTRANLVNGPAQFLGSGKTIAGDIHKLTSQSSEGQGLFFLDYAKVLETLPKP